MTTNNDDGIRLANDLMDALHVADLGPPDPQPYVRADSLEDRAEGLADGAGSADESAHTLHTTRGMTRMQGPGSDRVSDAQESGIVRVDPRGRLHVTGIRFASGPEVLAWLDPRIPAAASVLRAYVAALRREAAAARIEAREMRREVARLGEWIELHGGRS
jgi:hypothetical protein